MSIVLRRERPIVEYKEAKLPTAITRYRSEPTLRKEPEPIARSTINKLAKLAADNPAITEFLIDHAGQAANIVYETAKKHTVQKAKNWFNKTPAPSQGTITRSKDKYGNVTVTYTPVPKISPSKSSASTFVPTVGPVVPSSISSLSSVPVSSGTYTMSQQGKKSLSNSAFRGKNVSNVRYGPTAISRRMNVVSKPKMASGSRGIVVTHREYMSNIISHATTLNFKAIGLTLNPGKIAAFPWLSTIAGNFDKYRIIKCSIELVSNQATNVGGRIGVGFDYDSTDPLPADRTEFFSLTHHSECSVWDSLVFDIPLQGGVRFVNSHTVTDSKLIDYGQVIIMADQIVATNSNLGDAIISYTVELIDPQQAIMSTYSLTLTGGVGWNDSVRVGPAVGEMVPSTSLTVVDHKLPIGYYEFVIHMKDAALNPVATIDTSINVLGGANSFGNPNYGLQAGIFKVSMDDSIFRITLTGTDTSTLDSATLSITRLSPAVFVAKNANTFTIALAHTLPNP